MPFLKNFVKSMHALYCMFIFVMSPNPLPCTDTNRHKSPYGLSHHLVAKKTNTKNGKAKMHAKLLC